MKAQQNRPSRPLPGKRSSNQAITVNAFAMIEDLISEIKKYPDPLTREIPFARLKAFISDLYRDGQAEFATVSLPVQAVDPLACLEHLWKDDEEQFFWESPSDDLAVSGSGQLWETSAEGENRFGKISERFERLKSKTGEFSTLSHPCAGLIAFGGFAFFDEISGENWKSFKPASLTVPEWVLVKERKSAILTFNLKVTDYPSKESFLQHLLTQLGRFNSVWTANGAFRLQRTGNGDLTGRREMPKQPDTADEIYEHSHYKTWTSSVRRAKKMIARSRFQKIVLARDLTIPTRRKVSPVRIIDVLRSRYRRCYSFLIHRKSGETFLGCTPERLLSIRKNRVLTEALAGSMQRGQTVTEDAILEKSLVQSRKNRREHHFVIRDIEERLSPYAENIRRDARPEVKKLSNVQHLYTPITAKIKTGVDPLTLVKQLHPTPAVGGYPRQKAKPYIRRLETFERGWYAGPVGWLTSKGGAEFVVGIRSGLLKNGRAQFFAGCGIVEDSDPGTEWEETNLKLMPMLSALQYD